MDKSSSKTALFLFWLFIISVQIPSTVQERQQIDQTTEENLSFTKVVGRTISLLKHSHRSSLEKIKTAMHEIQLQYFPPNLDFRGSDKANQGMMKDAVGKSLKTSQETVKASAESAAEVVGKTVHKTAKKASQDVSREESDAEFI
ncbi:hypothetical protein L484_008328 [Morus notabilis]|uniref:Uncharacterized protein n=1 Tax=Morus notabilis TaxID=981085 RepID=W9RZW2_9ROSA|nr:hypothetical protein L484_008328 [Morus notabilis]